MSIITVIARSITAATLVACAVGTASAQSTGGSTPGIPGTPGCRGQTTAFLAQAAKNGWGDEAYHGIGGIGRLSDTPPPVIHAFVRAYCAGNLPCGSTISAPSDVDAPGARVLVSRRTRAASACWARPTRHAV